MLLCFAYNPECPDYPVFLETPTYLLFIFPPLSASPPDGQSPASIPQSPLPAEQSSPFVSRAVQDEQL